MRASRLIAWVFAVGAITCMPNVRTDFDPEVAFGSLRTELVIALVVRTRRPFFRSRPGNLLLGSTLVLLVVTMLVPWFPGAALIGFVPVPSRLLLALMMITVGYIVAAETTKWFFYRRSR